MRRPFGYAELLLCGLLAAGAQIASAQQVTLPLAQFEELRARANPAPSAAAPPPAPFAVESDELTVTAGPISARVVQTLTLTLYARDWQSIPLREAGSFIGADLGSLEGRIDPAAGALAVRGQGRYQVRLESVIAVDHDAVATRPTWHFVLRPPAAALVRGTLELTAALSPRVEEATLGASGLLHRAGAAAWNLVAVPAEDLDFKLLGKAVLPERAKLPLSFEATSASAATLSRTELRVHAQVQAKVAQGQLRELRLVLPPGLSVVGVNGPIAGWSVASPDLIVAPLEPIESTFAVEVELAGPPHDLFAAPLLLPSGASRTTLLARAGLRGDGLLTLADAGASRVADAAEMAAPGAASAAPGGERGDGKVYAILDPSHLPRWQAVWAERTEVLAAEVDELWVVAALGEAGSASYQVWAKVRNRGAEQLTVALPAGFELAGCTRDGIPFTPGVAAGAGGLAVPLLTREQPQLVYMAGILPLALPSERGDLVVPLPALSAPAARIRMRLLLPGGRAYTLADDTRRSEAETPPAANTVGDGTGKTPVARSGLAAVMLTQPSATPAIEQDTPLVLPAGFCQLAATWTALTAQPAPLVVHVKSAKEKDPWF
jgi:hypothetical protein